MLPLEQRCEDRFDRLVFDVVGLTRKLLPVIFALTEVFEPETLALLLF